MYGRLIAVMLLVALSFLPRVGFAQDPKKAATPARKDRHALLVGVSYYEKLPKSKHLVGPANDVVLMQNLLTQKFQVSPDKIVVLSEQEGSAQKSKGRGDAYYPNRANIEREFKRLALIAKPGDQVVIHMSGHGSQQPEDKNSPDPEPDGLDEIFLPRDTGAWDADKKTVTNAIIDDEMGAWLKAIRDKKASVWITFDSCHSGSMTRGSETAREIDPVDHLLIPKKDIEEAIAFAAKRDGVARSKDSDKAAPFKLAREGGIVAIYACQANEVTFELPLPAQSADAKVHGLLTYTLCKVLTEATERSKQPITYSELSRRVLDEYIRLGRMRPAPVIEGVDRDREVLGDKDWPGRSSLFLASDKEGYKINAGALHGLTEGSILAVTPPPGTGEGLLGHVRIKEVRAHTSLVEPCTFEQAPLAKSFPQGAVCNVAFIDVGDQQLRVAVDPQDADGKAIPDATRAELEKLLKTLAGPQSLIKPVDKASQADWLVRTDGKKATLVPGTGWGVGRSPLGNARYGPAPVDTNLGPWLTSGLNRIARADNLKRLAASGSSGTDNAAVRLDFKMLWRKDTADKLGSVPVVWPAPETIAYDADRLVCHFTNQGRTPVDLTVLYVDSGFGIECFYPREAASNRLLPGESAPVLMKFNNKTAGQEHLVVLAVKSKGHEVDFSSLVQPTLERALAKAGNNERATTTMESPLGRLLKRGVYGNGTTRGTSTQEAQDYAMFIVSFNVRPQKRPAAGSK